MGEGVARKSFDVSIPRLIQAWRDSRIADAYGRDRRREMVQQYVGPNWSEQTDVADLFLNLSSLYVQTILRTLIPKCPRFLLSTFDKAQAEAVNVMQGAGNRELVRMQADVTMRRIVYNAIFGVGIWRVALATAPEAAGRGWGQKGGEPILSNIDREDFAYDTFAGDFTECAWMAHQYRVPLKAVKEDSRFSGHRKDLKADEPMQYDEYGVEKIGILGRSFYGHEEIEDMVNLWEFYIPRERAILTFISDGAGVPCACLDNKPLGEQPWIGSEKGPYGFMGYYWVPGNAMSKGPMQDLFNTDVQLNKFYRKAAAEANRNKEVLVFSEEEDAKRVRDAEDGGTAYVGNPDAMKSAVYGGQNFQLIYGAGQAWRELFEFQGGNLALLSGRAQQAKTATQEQLLNQNAMGSISDLQETTIRSIDDMISRLCWFWWKHPFAAFEDTATLPGLKGIQHTRVAFPKGAKDKNGRPRSITRELDFERLTIGVDSYSLTPQTPQSRLAIMRQVWKEDILPALPLMQAQSLAADFNAYFQKLGRYLDDPDFQDLVTVRPPPPDMQKATPDGGPSLGGTERTYNRVSTSEATDKGQGKNQVTQLITGNEQGGDQEAEMVGATG